MLFRNYLVNDVVVKYSSVNTSYGSYLFDRKIKYSRLIFFFVVYFSLVFFLLTILIYFKFKFNRRKKIKKTSTIYLCKYPVFFAKIDGIMMSKHIKCWWARFYQHTPQKGLTICILEEKNNRPSRAKKESFPENFLLSD